MRVLHTVHAYPPDVGGSEAVVHRLSTGLSQRGHEVEVATSRHPERGRAVDGVPVHGFADDPIGWARYRRFVHAGLDEDRWDVVMTYHSKVFTHLALAPFNRVGSRWVYCPTEFTDIASPRPRHRVYYRTIEPMSLRKARCALVLTERAREQALALAPGIETTLEVVPNGVDFDAWANGEPGDVRERYNLPPRAPLVVYAGGLWEHKDVPTLVDALAKLGDAHLVVAGSQRGRREAIETRAGARGVADRVHLLGRVPTDDLRALYHAADAFTSASNNEGFGLVYLEAMACGLPVVARDVGVIPELVAQGANVRVAETPAEFARALESVLGRSSTTNRSLARTYDWARIVDRFEALYREIAREAPR